MKLYKLSQGSTFENLKTFIYVTNEYGVPSAEFVDAFIDQFGKIVLNGNFTLTQIEIKQLDILWIDIVKDCKYNNVEYKENYSNLFYISLCQKALLKIKEGYEQSDWNKLEETKKLELLKQFIVNFEQYKDEFIETKEITETPKYNYRLINSDFIGNELQITESVDDILSSYKANIVDEVNIRLADTGLIVDINMFIEEVENRNVELTIMSGFFKFEFLYREEEQDGE